MITVSTEFEEYLKPTEFIDYKSPEVQEFVKTCFSQDLGVSANMIKLYYKVRDLIMYDTYDIMFEPSFFKASSTINRGSGFCIPKGILLAAAARAIGVPSRLGYVDVTNHIASEKILKRMRSNVFVFHSYTDLFLEGKWVKATPAFNKTLCKKFNVEPLGFNGREDSLFQQFDKNGGKYMEYMKDHGVFADLPYEMMIDRFREAYPHMV
ncbi:MAG: transglutaminase [Bacteroidetes bacterium]|nr:MAG: transglutaminase [Bacteroidota bacterium]